MLCYGVEFMGQGPLWGSWSSKPLVCGSVPDLRIDTGDKAWKSFDAKQASFYNTSCGYIHVVYTK